MFVYRRVLYKVAHCGDRQRLTEAPHNTRSLIHNLIHTWGYRRCPTAADQWWHDTLYEEHVQLTHAGETPSCNSPQTKPAIMQFRGVYYSFGHTKHIFLCRLYTGCFFPTWPTFQSVVIALSERHSHCDRDLSLSPRIQACWGVQQCLWVSVNPLKPELNPICCLLALLGANHFLHVSRIKVKLLTRRLLMSYIYGAPILDVSRSHTKTHHSR